MAPDRAASGGLRVVREGLTVVRVAAPVLDVVAAEAPRSRDGEEAGGALFGFDASKHGPPLVSHATGPGQRAFREPDRFLRDLDYTREAAAAIHRETSAQWIGEWHTHPHGQPTPSETDIDSYLRHLRDPELAFETLLALIVAPLDAAWREATVYAWAVDLDAVWPLAIDVVPDKSVMTQERED
jgi:integrative and conjugative element protein (TIGR02256 family)